MGSDVPTTGQHRVRHSPWEAGVPSHSQMTQASLTLPEGAERRLTPLVQGQMSVTTGHLFLHLP